MDELSELIEDYFLSIIESLGIDVQVEISHLNDGLYSARLNIDIPNFNDPQELDPFWSELKTSIIRLKTIQQASNLKISLAFNGRIPAGGL